MTDLEPLKAMCTDGISLNECDLAMAVPGLIAEIESLRQALAVWSDRPE